MMQSANCAPTARTSQPIKDIITTAESFVKQIISVDDDETMHVKAGPIDSRLRLKPCPHPLTGFRPSSHNGTQISMVGVRCGEAGSWSLYVPVKVKIMTPVVVTKQLIMRNQPIEQQALALEVRDKQRLTRGYFKSTGEVLGYIAKRTIRPNTTLMPSAIRKPELVKKGQHVIIFGKNNRLEIRTKGIALAKGAYGEVIKVRNSKSARVLDAIIIGHGTVEVPL